MTRVKLATVKCEHCGHTWLPRVAAPAKCPKCFRALSA